MSKPAVFFFKILLISGGLILVYIIGRPMVETISLRANGQITQGRVIGFRGSGTSKTVFEENTAKYGKKHRARRPVYRYPITAGSLDSLDGYSGSGILLPWLNFEINEKVQVVFSKSDPSLSHIFSLGRLLTDLLLLLVSFYMIKLGLTKTGTG